MIPYKRIFTIFALACCCLVVTSAQTSRQRRDSHKDFIYLTGAAGYHGFLNQDSLLKNGPGVGAEIGVGYRMYHNHFIMSIGVEGKYGFAAIKPVDEKRVFPNTPDSEGDLMTLNADIYKRKDLMHTIDLQVPLLFGLEYNRFYAMAGAKFGLNVFGTAITKANLTTTGTYDRFSEDFQDMFNHQFLSGQAVRSEKQSVTFKPQVYATAEIGCRLGEFYNQAGADIPKAKQRYYIAAFAEYGILNIHQSNGVGEAITPYRDANGSYSFQVSPAYNSSTFRNALVNNLMVGVKFTMLFELPKSGKCVLCKEATSHRYVVRRPNNK